MSNFLFRAEKAGENIQKYEKPKSQIQNRAACTEPVEVRITFHPALFTGVFVI